MNHKYLIDAHQLFVFIIINIILATLDAVVMPFILQDQQRISGRGIKRTTDLYNSPERERESHDPSVSCSCGEE